MAELGAAFGSRVAAADSAGVQALRLHGCTLRWRDDGKEKDLRVICVPDQGEDPFWADAGAQLAFFWLRERGIQTHVLRASNWLIEGVALDDFVAGVRDAIKRRDGSLVELYGVMCNGRYFEVRNGRNGTTGWRVWMLFEYDGAACKVYVCKDSDPFDSEGEAQVIRDGLEFAAQRKMIGPAFREVFPSDA